MDEREQITDRPFAVVRDEARVAEELGAQPQVMGAEHCFARCTEDVRLELRERGEVVRLKRADRISAHDDLLANHHAPDACQHR
jgi:hypothetical protein